jgi:hypothetical protein
MLTKIAVVNDPTRDGRLISANSLSCDDQPKPIISRYDLDTKKVDWLREDLWGKFDNVTERDGAIFADVTPNIPEGWCITIDVQIDVVTEGNPLVIQKGKIIGGHLSPIDNWPCDQQPSFGESHA